MKKWFQYERSLVDSVFLYSNLKKFNNNCDVNSKKTVGTFTFYCSCVHIFCCYRLIRTASKTWTISLGCWKIILIWLYIFDIPWLLNETIIDFFDCCITQKWTRCKNSWAGRLQFVNAVINCWTVIFKQNMYLCT